MGAWADYESENLEEDPGAGDGDETAVISLNPGEKKQVFVERTDEAAAGDDWRIYYEGSIEDTPNFATDPPMREYRMKGTQTKKTFLIAGPFNGRIGIENDDTDTDRVAATVGWKKDGVSI